jgi:hypothetical protein
VRRPNIHRTPRAARLSPADRGEAGFAYLPALGFAGQAAAQTTTSAASAIREHSASNMMRTPPELPSVKTARDSKWGEGVDTVRFGSKLPLLALRSYGPGIAGCGPLRALIPATGIDSKRTLLVPSPIGPRIGPEWSFIAPVEPTQALFYVTG